MFTKTKKWLIAALAAIAIIALSVCGVLMFASADDGDIDWSSVNGANVYSESDLSGIEDIGDTATKYVLQADVSLNSSLTIAADTDVYIDLNGYTLSIAEASATTRVVLVYGNLTLADSSEEGTGKISGGFAAYKTELSDLATLEADENDIYENCLGGGVYVYGGTFTMNGGTICGNYSYAGGGVVLSAYSTFTMNGGEISNNYAYSMGAGGGGIYCYFGSQIILNGGKITENTALYMGGGIYCAGTLIINDGEISNNVASMGAGISTSYVTVMNGGSVINNTAKLYDSTLDITDTTYAEYIELYGYNGGGIRVSGGAESDFYLYGGTISGNTVEASSTYATDGGGIFSRYININVKGSPVVTNNTVGSTTNNIELQYAGAYLTLDDAITSGASLGITAQSKGLVVKTNGYTVSGTITLDSGAALTSGTRGYYYGSALGDTEQGDNTVSVTAGENTYYYSTLEEAIASNLADEYTVTLLADAALTSPVAIPDGATVTLTADSAAKITYASPVDHWIFVNDGTSLTITGAITFDGEDEDHDDETNYSNSSVIFSAGTLVVGTTDNSDTDPTFQNMYTAHVFYVTSIRTYDTTYLPYRDEDGNAIYEGGRLTINGGTFDNNSAVVEGSSSSGSVVYTNQNTTVTINDGTFTNNSATNGGVIYINYYTTLTINKGTFGTENNYNSGTSSGGVIFLRSYSTAYIKGGTYSYNKAGIGGVIYTQSGVTLEIDGATFSNNSAEYGTYKQAAAMYISGSTATIKNSTFAYSTSGGNGGAVFVTGSSKVTFSCNTFTGNTATDSSGGAAIISGTSEVTFEGDSFKSNTAKYGGAINVTGTAEVTIKDDTTFTSNYASTGGAIYVYNTATCTVEGGTFTDNGISGDLTTSSGGAIINYGTLNIEGGTFTGNTASNGGAVTNSAYGGYYGNLTITGGTFGGDSLESANTSTGTGGAVYIQAGTTASISGSAEFKYNKATNGAAVYIVADATVDISGGTYTGNAASSSGGGAIYIASDKVTLTGGTFTANTAASGNGGAVYINNGITQEISGATFSGNSANNGGAVYAGTGADVTISDCTFGSETTTDGNTATNRGGAIYAYTSAELTIKDSTFNNNSSTSGDGGAIYAYSGVTLTITNSTFENSKAENGNGGAVYVYANSSTTISNGTFTTNSAKNGGAVYIGSASGSAGSVTISGGTYTTNSATMYGGALYVNSYASKVEISGAQFTGNTSVSGGGAVYLNTNCSNVDISGATFTSNTITAATTSTASLYTYGGAVYIGDSGSGEISDSTFTSNGITENFTAKYGATIAGGAVYIGKTATINITDCTYTSNTLSNTSQYGTNDSNSSIFNLSHGGAIYINTGSTVTITGGSFTGNEVTAENSDVSGRGQSYGAAIYVNSGGSAKSTLELNGTSITGNSVNGSNGSGAVYLANYSTLKVLGDTVISGNKKGTTNSNVYIYDNSYIELGKLTSGADIGVTVRTYSDALNITTAEESTSYYLAATQYITYDTTAYTVAADTTNGYLIVISSSANIHTVNYYKDSESTEADYVVKLYVESDSTSYTIDTSIFTNSGNVFQGYATTANGEVAYTTNTKLTGLAGGSTTSLYAVWKGSNYSISVTQGDSATWTADSSTLAFAGAYKQISGSTVQVMLESAATAITDESISVSVSGIVTASVSDNTLTITPVTTLAVSGSPYTTVITITAADGSTHDITVTVTVSKATVALPTGYLETTTYTGAEQSWITLDGTELYTVSGDVTATNVGEYTVTLALADADNYQWATEPEASYTWSITAKSIENAEITITSNLVYTGEEQTVVYTVAIDGITGEITYTITEGSDTGTAATTYTLTLTGSGNFTGEATASWTIAAAEMSVTAKGYSGVYNGNAYGGSVTATTVDGCEYTVTYGETEGTYTLDTKPTYSAVGEYTVYFKISAENHNDYTGSYTIIISEMANSWTSELTIEGWTYGETANAPVITAAYGTVVYTYSTSENGTYTTTVPTAAGTYYVKAYVEATTTYTELESDPVSFTIAKATYDMSGVTMNASTVTYDGKTHSIEISGTLPTGVTVAYSGSYTNVGTYTITASFTGDSNYNEIAGLEATLTISNASLTVTTSGYTSAYDGTAHTGSVAATTVDNSTATIAYGTTKGTYDLTNIPSYTDAGTYKIYYQVTAANHTTKTGYITVEITSVVSADTTSTVNGSVTSDSFVVNNVSYVMNEVSESDYEEAVERAIVNVVAHVDGVDNAEVVAIYDITLTSNGETITVSEATNGGTITIKVALPESLAETDTFYIVHIHDGSFKTIISSNSYTVEDGYVTFSTNTLSQFVFVVPTEATADSGSTDSGSSSGGSTEGGSTSGGSSSGSTDSGSTSVDTGTTDIGGTDDGNGTLLTVVLVTGGVVIVLAAVIIVAVVLKKRKS